MALLITLSLQAALVRSFDQLGSDTHVHLLVATLYIISTLVHLGLTQIIVIIIAAALSNGTHQYLICFVTRLLHLAIGTNQLISVLLANELKISLVLILETHQVRLAQWQLPIWRETLALVAIAIYSRVAPVIAEVELAC